MLLLLADLWKALWFLIFPAVSLAQHGIATESTFCQVGGFFVQASIEACGTSNGKRYAYKF